MFPFALSFVFVLIAFPCHNSTFCTLLGVGHSTHPSERAYDSRRYQTEDMHARLDEFFARRQFESQDARRQKNGPLFEASVSTFIDESEDDSVKDIETKKLLPINMG